MTTYAEKAGADPQEHARVVLAQVKAACMRVRRLQPEKRFEVLMSRETLELIKSLWVAPNINVNYETCCGLPMTICGESGTWEVREVQS